MLSVLKPATSILHLSYDVLDLIVEEMCCEGFTWEVLSQHLAACRLISHTFNAVATPRMFKDIYLAGMRIGSHDWGAQFSEVRTGQFLSIIEVNPVIATFVRGCHIHANSYHRKEGQLCSWITESKALSAVLPQLTDVQHFTIKGGHGTLHWSMLNKKVAKALHGMLERPTLLYLRIKDVQGLPLITILDQRVLNRKISTSAPPYDLTSLVICCYTLRKSNLLQSNYITPTHTDLQATDIDYCYAIQKLKLITGFESAETLAGSDAWEMILQVLFKKLATGLESLEVDYTPNFTRDHWPAGACLSLLQSMKTLILRQRVVYLDIEVCTGIVPASFIHTLKCQKPISNLRTMHLIIAVHRPASMLWIIAPDWSVLKGLICKMYPRLQNLVIEFQYSKEATNTPLSQEMKQNIRNILSCIVPSAKSVTVKITIPLTASQPLVYNLSSGHSGL